MGRSSFDFAVTARLHHDLVKNLMAKGATRLDAEVASGDINDFADEIAREHWQTIADQEIDPKGLG